MSADKEALRQRMLLRTLWRDARPGVLAGWTRDGRLFERGLQAYRANAGALAERALAAAFPTLQQLLGDESFAALARHFWLADPPAQGDIGTWGEGLAGFVGRAPTLASEPYLADVARLEWAVHRAASAADDDAPVAGLERLAHGDPAALCLRPRAGTVLLMGAHPAVSIWQAHRLPAGRHPDRFDAVRAALAQNRAEAGLVWRTGWQVQVAALEPAEARFTHALLQGQSLGTAWQAAAASAAFDFEPWLLAQLQRGWIAGWGAPGTLWGPEGQAGISDVGSPVGPPGPPEHGEHLP